KRVVPDIGVHVRRTLKLVSPHGRVRVGYDERRSTHGNRHAELRFWSGNAVERSIEATAGYIDRTDEEIRGVFPWRANNYILSANAYGSPEKCVFIMSVSQRGCLRDGARPTTEHRFGEIVGLSTQAGRC